LYVGASTQASPNKGFIEFKYSVGPKCSDGTVDQVNPDYPLNIAIVANSSSSKQVSGILGKFKSSLPTFCPIISYEISKVLDSQNKEVNNFAEFI
jgi:hypothetical protein